MRKIMLVFVIGINLAPAYNNDFLILGGGGKGTGMGGAFTSIANSGSGLYWNPAGTGLLSNTTFLVANNSYFGFFKDFLFVMNHPIDEHFSGAISILYYTSSPIEEYPVSDTINEGDPIGYFNYNNILLIGNCAYTSGKFAFGGNFSIQRQEMLGYIGFGMKMDFGIIYQGIVNIGASGFGILSNSIQWSRTDYKEPQERYFKIGISKRISTGNDKILPSFDILYSYSKFYPELGIEYSLKDIFQFRAGYNSLLSYTFGAGFNFWKMEINYSLAFSEIGPINRIALTYIRR